MPAAADGGPTRRGVARDARPGPRRRRARPPRPPRPGGRSSPRPRRRGRRGAPAGPPGSASVASSRRSGRPITAASARHSLVGLDRHGEPRRPDPGVAYTPCGAAPTALGCRPVRRRCRTRSTRSIGLCRDAERGVEHAPTSTSEPSPVSSRRSSATSAANTACTPPFGSHGPRWMRGWSSAAPVIHASPDACSMFCAKPGPIPPRPVEPVRRHAHQDGAGVGRVDLVPPEAELVEDPGREVLHHHVGRARRGRARARGPSAGEVERERPACSC